jgi:hypothetical protein
MTAQQFHEGQDVEVADAREIPGDYAGDLSSAPWRKAKIARVMDELETVRVIFPDGTRAVFDVAHVRAADSTARIAAKKIAHDLGEALMGRGRYAEP